MPRATGTLTWILALACGCTSDPAPAACLSDLPLDCTPAYVPTYDAIFADVLVQSCGSSGTGSSCHYGPSPEMAQGGLPLSEPDTAYRALLGELDGRARVIRGDPECSILVERLESSDPGFRMPVGTSPLPENVRCAIRQWIAMGAPR
jgi:hypothetical protein